MKEDKLPSVRTGVMYIRESTEEQGKGYSPDAQRKGMREYAKRNNIKIVGEYIDLLSGRTDNRPQFQQMVADAEAQKFNTLLVFKTSRFARNRSVAIEYKNKLRKMGVQVIFTSEDLGENAHDPNKMLIEGFYELFDEQLSNQISQWTREGFKEKRSSGYLLGKPPLGYYRKPGNAKDLFIDDQAAALVREMFEQYATGNVSLQDIAVKANKVGATTKLGNPFTYSSVKCILQNRAYLGFVPVSKLGQQELVGKHEPLIERDLFDRVQLMFKTRTKTKGRPPAKHRFYLLQGMVYCYRCYKHIKGKENASANAKLLPTMYSQTMVCRNGEEYYYYCCKFRRENKSCVQKPVRCSIIDDQVLVFLGGMKMPEQVIKRVLDRLGHIYDSYDTPDTRSGKMDELSLLRGKLDKLNHMYLHTESISMDDYDKRSAEITTRIKELEEDSGMNMKPVNKEQMLKATEIFMRNIPSAIAAGKLSSEELRSWITLVIKRIWVKDRKVIAIEPHDDYKGLFVATRKVLTQGPLGTPVKTLDVFSRVFAIITGAITQICTNMTGHSLPIENDREMLAEYGRAVAWCNMVEFMLGHVIVFQGKLSHANPILVDKLIGGKTLGAKIQLATGLISLETKKKLEQLNANRIQLAHGVTGEVVSTDNPQQPTGKYVISVNNKEQPFTQTLLHDTISLAQDLSEDLRKELLKGTRFAEAEKQGHQ